MQVRQVNFKEAVRWLSGYDLALRPSNLELRSPLDEQEPRSLEMPAVNQHRWAAVREYLIATRKLPDALVDRLHEKGLVYADDYQNAVFVRHGFGNWHWLRGDITGASLRGTWGEHNVYHGLAPGSVRDNGWFWIGAGKGAVQRVMLTESPIDAMSLATLDRHRPGVQGITIYLSTDGAGAIPVAALKQVLEQGGQVAIAFDADRSGEAMAWRVAQQLPRARR